MRKVVRYAVENITPEQFTSAAYVLLAFFGAIVTLDKVVDIIRKWKAPSTDTAKKLDNDKKRLDDHEASIHMLQESSRVQLAALQAMLDHELHNGNSEEMQKARDDINKYLTSLVAK